VFLGVRVRTISKSAGGPGNEEKGRAIGSGEAPAMQAKQGMQASAPIAAKAVLVPPIVEEKIAPIMPKIKALLDDVFKPVMVFSRSNGNRVQYRSKTNSEIKEIIANIEDRYWIPAIRAFAEIYFNDDNFEKRNNALTILCCTVEVGYEMISEFRERFWKTGSLKFTEHERDYIKIKFTKMNEQIKEEQHQESQTTMDVNEVIK